MFRSKHSTSPPPTTSRTLPYAHNNNTTTNNNTSGSTSKPPHKKTLSWSSQDKNHSAPLEMKINRIFGVVLPAWMRYLVVLGAVISLSNGVVLVKFAVVDRWGGGGGNNDNSNNGGNNKGLVVGGIESSYINNDNNNNNANIINNNNANQADLIVEEEEDEIGYGDFDRGNDSLSAPQGAEDATREAQLEQEFQQVALLDAVAAEGEFGESVVEKKEGDRETDLQDGNYVELEIHVLACER